jgi:hypothetical protein
VFAFDFLMGVIGAIMHPILTVRSWLDTKKERDDSQRNVG